MYKKIDDIPNEKKYLKLSATYGYQKACYDYGLTCYDNILLETPIQEKEEAIRYLSRASLTNKNAYLYIGFKFQLMII